MLFMISLRHLLSKLGAVDVFYFTLSSASLCSFFKLSGGNGNTFAPCLVSICGMIMEAASSYEEA